MQVAHWYNGKNNLISLELHSIASPTAWTLENSYIVPVKLYIVA